MTNPTLTLSPSIDGWIRNNPGSGTWAAARAAGSGTDTYPSLATMYAASDSGTPLIGRARLSFDTSSIPDGATIISAKLRLYGVSVTGSGSLCLVQSTAASHTALATADFSAYLTTELASRIAAGSWSTSGYNEFTLNSSGRAIIDKAGYADFLLLHSSDLDNSNPGAAPNFQMYTQDQAGTTQDPELVVVYSLDRAATDTITWRDGSDYDGPHVHSKSIADTVTWGDSAARRDPPAARTAVGSQVAIFTSNGSAGTFGAHYAFACTVALPDGKTLLSVARKASTHASFDGILVGKTSTDDGNTWSSEFTIIDETAGGWDWRDPYVTVLASGRLALTGGRRKQVSGFSQSKPPFLYSDDNGATWQSSLGAGTPYLLSDVESGLFSGTSGSVTGGVYGSDIVEKANGDLIMVGYGYHSSGSSAIDLFCSKSTNGGSSWAALSKPSTYATYGYNTVEPQADITSTGDIYLTFHTEDGVPTDWYRTRSRDGGSTWTTPIKMGSGDTLNRQGMSVFSDDRIIVSVNLFSGFSFGYYESYNGNLFGSYVQVSANPPTAGYTANLWIMVTPLGGTGESQNVGFTYGAEVNTQDKANVYWRQFTGSNGSAVYRRGSSDTVTWTDAASRQATPARGPSQTITWGDTVSYTTPVSTRGLTGTIAWGDSVSTGSTSTQTRGVTDSITWGGGQTTTTFTPQGSVVFVLNVQMPDGTVVGAYRRHEWLGSIDARLNAGPGPVVQESVVADSTVRFYGLPAGQWVAYSSTFPKRRLYFFSGQP